MRSRDMDSSVSVVDLIQWSMPQYYYFCNRCPCREGAVPVYMQKVSELYARQRMAPECFWLHLSWTELAADSFRETLRLLLQSDRKLDGLVVALNTAFAYRNLRSG